MAETESVIDAYPLAWPSGKPRTPRHRIERSRFDPGNRPTEVANVRSELVRLGAKGIVVSTNMRLRRDGLPYAADRPPEDQGVAVYFTYAGGQKCFACDRWTKIEENLRAIFKSVEAIRGLERWGSKSFVEAAFAGFSALPAPGAHAKRDWRQVFGVSQHWSGDAFEIKGRYRRLASERHPDAPDGSHDAMSELNGARDEALAEVANG